MPARGVEPAATATEVSFPLGEAMVTTLSGVMELAPAPGVTETEEMRACTADEL